MKSVSKGDLLGTYLELYCVIKTVYTWVVENWKSFDS